MGNISTARLKLLREEYPTGTRVSLESMEDPYINMTLGTQGTVTLVDDIGTIHVNWDDGCTLGIVFGEDKCSKIEN